MEKLYFVTSNQGKIDNLNLFMKEITEDYDFEMLKIDFKELKNDDSMEETALNKAVTCLELTDTDSVIVSDTGIFIEELNGFPGVNTGFTVRTLGNQGILKLMEGKSNRKGYFQVSMAYVKKDGTKEVFTGKSDIEIAESENGKLGFAWDSIVTGNGERFSENLSNEKRVKPYKESIKKLIEFIENGN